MKIIISKFQFISIECTDTDNNIRVDTRKTFIGVVSFQSLYRMLPKGQQAQKQNPYQKSITLTILIWSYDASSIYIYTANERQ